MGETTLAFSPDGRRVAIGASDGKIHVNDADTGAAVGPPLSGHTGAVNIVAYSGDGTRIISGGDSTIHVWAAEPDQAIGTRLPGLAFVGSAARGGQSRREHRRDTRRGQRIRHRVVAN